MKRIFFFLAIVASVSFLSSCNHNDDGDHMDDDPQYSITINSPNTDDKQVNDDIHIHVVFESATSETVHHANVRIYNKADNAIEIYNGPAAEHVHETSGKYELHADLALTEANDVMEDTDWILEAKVWGHEGGVGEVMESIEFHVHPE
ncbi:MAG: hypothetical protein ACI8VT_002856 [Saprospiraceae bacterium]|jgi:hypothetical protein